MRIKNELRYYGINTCKAIWQRRKQDVVRIYITKENLQEFAETLSWCAAKKIAYHLVEDIEIEKYCRAVHHEGICFLARELPELSFEDFESSLKASNNLPECILYLDGVSNPHNLGGILRTAAHFGVKFVLGSKNQLPQLSPSLCRVSQGASEYVSLVRATKPLRSLETLKSLGFSVISAAPGTKISLYDFKFPPRAIVCLGSEGSGVSKDILKASNNKITIPGTGEIESLNVSCAASVVMGEYWRQLNCK